MALAVLFVHLVLSPLIFSPASADVFEFPKTMLLRTMAILLLGIGASWFAGQVLRAEWRLRLRRDPIAWGVLAFLASGAISTGFSMSPHISLVGAHESFAGLLQLLGWAVLFFATRAAVSDLSDARRLLWATALASAGACTYALIQLAGADPIAWERTANVGTYTRTFGTMGHPILLAGFLVTAFPVCAYLAVNAWQRGRIAGAGVALTALLLGGVVILASLSRGAWLALVVAFLACLIGWWRVGERSGVRVLLGGAVAGLALLVLGLLALVGDSSALIQGLLARIGSATQLGSEPRLHIWSAAWQMFLQHPITGVGVDAFQLAFEQVRPTAYWQVEWGATPTRAHNDVLHVAATQGALGLGALALLVSGLVLAWRRALGGARSLEEKGLVVAIGAGLLGFGAQSLFSFTVAGTGSLFVTYAALLSHLSRLDPARSHSGAVMGRSRWLALVPARAAVLGAVLLALLYGVLDPIRANTLFQSGRQLRLQGEPDTAIPYVTRALALDGDQQIYWIELCAAHYAAGTRDAPSDQKRTHLEQARRAATHAIGLVPLDGHGHANLGMTLLALAMLDPPGATASQVFQAFDQAIDIDETNALFLSEAAHAGLKLGDLERAWSYAARNGKHYPDYAPARIQLGEVALRRSNWESAVAEFGAALEGSWHGTSNHTRAWKGLARAKFELGRPEEALRAAQEAVTLSPDDAEAWTERGRAQEALALSGGASAQRLRREAIDSYGRAFLLDPSEPDARVALDRLLTPGGD